MNPVSKTTQEYLKKFKLYPQVTLFELDARDLKKYMICFYPNCGRKLKVTLDKKHAYCASKGKHPKLFFKL